MGMDIVTKHRERLDCSTHGKEHPHPQLLRGFMFLTILSQSEQQSASYPCPPLVNRYLNGAIHDCSNEPQQGSAGG